VVASLRAPPAEAVISHMANIRPVRLGAEFSALFVTPMSAFGNLPRDKNCPQQAFGTKVRR